MPEFTWLPANRASTEDVEAVFAPGVPKALPGHEVPGGSGAIALRRSGTPRCWSRPPAAPPDPVGLIGYVATAGGVGGGREGGRPPAVEPEATVDAHGSRAGGVGRSPASSSTGWRHGRLTYESPPHGRVRPDRSAPDVLEGYPDRAAAGEDRDLGRGVGRPGAGLPRGRLPGGGLAHPAAACGAASTGRPLMSGASRRKARPSSGARVSPSPSAALGDAPMLQLERSAARPRGVVPLPSR